MSKYLTSPDDVITGVQKTINLLNYMLGERSQLYGTVIYLMQMLEKDRIVMPTIEAMREYHESLLVAFDVEDEEFVVRLIDRSEAENQEEGDGE